jgi:hypothetical protein
MDAAVEDPAAPPFKTQLFVAELSNERVNDPYIAVAATLLFIPNPVVYCTLDKALAVFTYILLEIYPEVVKLPDPI